VGVTLGVAPNPYNTLNDQLAQKQIQLDEQQADLAAREAAFASSTAADIGGTPMAALVGYLAIAVGALALFVGLNFYLDWRRSRGAVPGEIPPPPRDTINR